MSEETEAIFYAVERVKLRDGKVHGVCETADIQKTFKTLNCSSYGLLFEDWL